MSKYEVLTGVRAMKHDSTSLSDKLYQIEKICLEKRFIHVENVVIVIIVMCTDINLPVEVGVLKCNKK